MCGTESLHSSEESEDTRELEWEEKFGMVMTKALSHKIEFKNLILKNHKMKNILMISNYFTSSSMN